jgi:chromosome transmission fidelity protein 4
MVVKVVSIEDPRTLKTLDEQRRPVKHLSFHPNGEMLAVSSSDGAIYIYSLATSGIELVKRLDGLIPALDTEAEHSSHAIWHPGGRAISAPTATRGI